MTQHVDSGYERETGAATAVQERFTRQERWNEMGKDRLSEVEQEPERFLVDKSPHAHRMAHAALMEALGPLAGKKVLELGSGHGEFAVHLAKQGAQVTGVDIGPDLTAASRRIAAINNVSCRFLTNNVTKLPFADEEFDVVVGIDVLHHLVETDLRQAISECHRVLKRDGCAVLIEPVENSKAFAFLQNLFPVGTKGGPGYRPSILQRAAWRDFLSARDQRALTNAELLSAGGAFGSVRLRPYGFLIRLRRLLGGRTKGPLTALDRVLFRFFPPLRRFCRSVLVEYRKSEPARPGRPEALA